eukprot:952399-Pyramimonas_sp.AAC.2
MSSTPLAGSASGRMAKLHPQRSIRLRALPRPAVDLRLRELGLAQLPRPSGELMRGRTRTGNMLLSSPGGWCSA